MDSAEGRSTGTGPDGRGATPAAVSLRPRVDADLPAICTWARSPEEAERWGGHSLHHPVTPEQLRADEGRPGHSAWVLARAVDGGDSDGTRRDAPGAPLAQFELRTAEGTSRIARVIVDPALRGQGLGARLVEAAVEVARRAGATRVELGVVPGNRPAIGLYLRCGFGWDGESRGYPRMALTLPR